MDQAEKFIEFIVNGYEREREKKGYERKGYEREGEGEGQRKMDIFVSGMSMGGLIAFKLCVKY